MSDTENEVSKGVTNDSKQQLAASPNCSQSNLETLKQCSLPVASGEVLIDSEDNLTTDNVEGAAVGAESIDDDDLDEVNDNVENTVDDNLSLEVNFGDGSSCRASDVSSISFQNIILDDPDYDFDPLCNQHDQSSIKDSISESSDSPLHDFPSEENECIYTGRFAEEIKLREHPVRKNKFCPSGDGCGTDDDELTFDSPMNEGTLKRVVKQTDQNPNNSLITEYDSHVNSFSLTAASYLPCKASSSASIASPNNCGGGSSYFTNNKKLCTDGDVGFNGSFQGAACDGDDKADIVHGDEAMVCSSDQLSLSSSDNTVSGKPESGSDCDINPSSKEQTPQNDSRNNSKTGGVKMEPIPKVYRRSPGLARRMPEDRDSSSSEKELDTTQIDTTVQSTQKNLDNNGKKGGKTRYSMNGDKKRSVAVEKQLKESIIENLRDLSPEKQTSCQGTPNNQPDAYVQFENVINNLNQLQEHQNKSDSGKDVENEYDYVKYARIQHGDSYVGMRLAFTTDEKDKDTSEGNIQSGIVDEHFPPSSREGSPDKILRLQQKRRELNEPIKVSEESLTEISLNGSDHMLSDEHKNISLSPEMTECDSAEVESVLSDEGKSIASGMPNVDDGLSSSQGSDVEDIPNHDSKYAEMLKRRHKIDIAQEIEDLQQKLNEKEVRDFFMPAQKGGISSQECSPAHQEIIRKKKDALDLAIKDIKEAIEKSRQGNNPSPSHKDQPKEPPVQTEEDSIWVMRESYAKKLQQDEDLQDSRYEGGDRRAEQDYGDDEPQVYHIDSDKQTNLKFQYSRNEGKNIHQSPKGYESDDDYPDAGMHANAGIPRARGYASVPPDDPVEKSYIQNHTHTPSSLRVYGPSMFFKSSTGNSSHNNKRNPGSRSDPNLNRHTTDSNNSFENQHQQRYSSGAGYRPKYNNFSGTVPSSRYRSDEQDNSISDRDRILQSYGYQGTLSPGAHSNNNSIPSSPNDPSYNSEQMYDPNHQHHSPPAGESSHNNYRESNHVCQHHSCHNNPNRDYHSNQQHHHGNRYSQQQPKHSQSVPNISESSGSGGGGGCSNSDAPDDDFNQDEYYAGEPAVYVKTKQDGDFDTDEETDELLHKQYHKDQRVDIPELNSPPVNREAQSDQRKSRVREGEQESLTLRDPDNDTVLIEGVLFRARYLGSTTLISEGQPSKSMRMMQAQEAVGRIKAMGKLHFGDKFQAPEGENQPSTDVDLFVSTEKIMVLNTNLQEIMMDHSLRTISYIADIGEIIVIMARRGPVSPVEGGPMKHQSKICCHVFETDEAQLIAQSIGQAFQVAYMEFLKANGIEDPNIMKEMDYQEVLNQQEIFGEELFLFSNKETQKEVIVPKMKNEPLGVVIVESGWGSMVPTVVLANMNPTGAAARCGQLNIGDQIMSINGVSLVGLPLSSCQNYIKVAKNQTVIKLSVVSCAPVVEVLVKRPDVKYQLGFSVQNGVICSLLRGGIAERGGVRVGHRIIEINGSSVVAVPHEKIVNMLATAVGEIHMKTMPTSIFRLLTGQETPHYI